MAVGLFGKVPTRGDFVTSGIAPEVVELWDATMAALRANAEEMIGPTWAELWDVAPAWCFWIGTGVQAGPSAGVLRPSRDRVGRRYPMLLLADGAEGLPAPPHILDPDSVAWYSEAVALSERLMDPKSQVRPAEIVAELRDPPRVIGAPDDARAAFFAEGLTGLADLAYDISAHDHGLAAARRSYWWAEAEGGAAVFMAMEGLPEPAMASALLQSCTRRVTPAAPEAPPEAPEPEAAEPAPEAPPPISASAPPVIEEDAPAPEGPSPAEDPVEETPSPAAEPDPDVTQPGDHRSPFEAEGGDESPFGDDPAPKQRPGLAARLRGRH